MKARLRSAQKRTRPASGIGRFAGRALRPAKHRSRRINQEVEATAVPLARQPARSAAPLVGAGLLLALHCASRPAAQPQPGANGRPTAEGVD